MSSPRGTQASNLPSTDPQHSRKFSNDAHASVTVKNAMTNHDLEYFEQMIQQCNEDLMKPLMQRRAGKIKDDPVEEIQELYNEIKDSEKKFKKVIEITCKNKLYLIDLFRIYD